MKNILFLILSFCACTEMVFGAVTWSSPASISTASVNATNPHVVIDTNGNAAAAWVENNVIMAATLPFGGSWTSPVAISNGANTSSMPKLGVDSSGNVTAAWIENNVLESATLPFGGSWSAETAVSGSGVTEFSLDVDASGHAVVVWIRSGSVEAALRTSGTWSLVSTLSSTTSSSPHVKISSNGQAMAVWHSVSSGNDIIVSDLLTVSTNTWAATKNVTTATPAFKFNYPKVAIDSNGNATAAAFRYNYNATTGAYYNVQVITSTLTSGSSSWGLGTLLSNSGIGNPANLTLKLKADVNGDVLAIWTNLYDGMTYTIESANKIFGANWPSAILPQNPSLYSFGMDAAVSQGSAILTNMTWDGTNINMVSQETDTTDPLAQGWTPINQFSTGADNAYPACALNVTSSQLDAVVVWVNYNGTNTVINASSGTDAVVVPPSGISASQSSINYGVFIDYVNTITWSASTDPNLVQYNIYRDGEFFASTAPGTLTVDDHNQISSGSGTVIYGVSALNSDFRQSAMITATVP